MANDLRRRVARKLKELYEQEEQLIEAHIQGQETSAERRKELTAQIEVLERLLEEESEEPPRPPQGTQH